MPSKKHEAVDQTSMGFGLPDDIAAETAEFQSEQISFPPYWSPEVGKKFLAMPISLDDRDPEFNRWVLQACHAIPCEKGDKHSRENVTVDKDEFFTMSVYAGLPLANYIGFRCLISVTGTRDVGQPQDMFVFDLKLSKEDRTMLAVDRRARAAAAIAKYRENQKAKQLNGGAMAKKPEEMAGEVVKPQTTAKAAPPF